MKIEKNKTLTSIDNTGDSSPSLSKKNAQSSGTKTSLYRGLKIVSLPNETLIQGSFESFSDLMNKIDRVYPHIDFNPSHVKP